MMQAAANSPLLATYCPTIQPQRRHPCPASTVIPSLAYKDALAAIDFLVAAFGFTAQAVHTSPAGSVEHAQLTFPGGGMIMLGSAKKEGPWAERMLHPQDAGGKVTSGLYLIVPDCAAALDRARAAGAEITDELRTMDYGGRAFACKDPEGYPWSFGEYDPWS